MHSQTPNTKSQVKHASLADGDLVKMAWEGDKWAFVEIVARYQATVSGVALAILKDFGASEDVAQEVFLEAWKKIKNLREPGKLRSWLVSIARSKSLDRLRRCKQEETLDPNLQLACGTNRQPDEMAASRDEVALVLSALDRIPELYRLPLILYYREDHSIGLVAESLGITQDAARKRLSRGRAMLRKEMDGVVDSVLSRTLPTTVFTMTVAAAIGALSKPATMAALTFAQAGATKASTATTAASAASLGTITTMTTTKLTLAVTAMAAVSLSVGYQVHVATEPDLSEPPAAVAMPSTKPLEREIAPALPDSRFVAEWKRLHEEHGSGPEAMPLIHAAIKDLPSSFQRRAFRSALATEWAEVSPETGWSFYGRNGTWNWESNLFLGEAVRLGGWEAIDVAVADASWKKRLRRNLPKVMENFLPKIGERAPEALAALIDQLPKSRGEWDEDVREAFARLAVERFEYARGAAEKTTGANRGEALSGMAVVWAEQDGRAAFEWAQGELEGAERNRLVQSVLAGWAKTDPAAALAKVAEIPAIGGNSVHRSTTTAQHVLRAAADADFDATVAWLKNNPGKIGWRDLASLDSAILPRLMTDPAGFLSKAEADGSLGVLEHGITQTLLNSGSVAFQAVWDHLGEMEESKTNNRLRQVMLNALAYREPGAALQLLQSLPADERSPGLVELTFRGFFNGGDLLDRFDGLFKQTLPELRPDLLHTGFSYLEKENIGDPRVWSERFVELESGARRDVALKSLARVWTELDPFASTAWLATLEVEYQEIGYREAASQWAQVDEAGAAEWVGQLQQGKGRDVSIAGLVDGMVRSAPEAAWGWTELIEDAGLRMETTERVLKPLIDQDAERARQLLEESSLSAEEKAQALRWFERN